MDYHKDLTCWRVSFVVDSCSVVGKALDWCTVVILFSDVIPTLVVTLVSPKSLVAEEGDVIIFLEVRISLVVGVPD